MGIVRCAVVHSPAWPLVAAVIHGMHHRGPEVHVQQPLAVFRAQRVWCCSPRAWQGGVRPGQRRRQAQGACPDLIIVADDDERDMRWFEPIARSIGELVPLIDLETPGSILLATRGPSRYVGGDAALAVRLTELTMAGLDQMSTGRIGHVIDVADLCGVGGGFGVGIADGRLASTLAARAAARRREPIVVEPGREATAAFLAPHPVRVLNTVAGCSVDIVELLERLGVRCLGDLAALSPEHLFDRFAAVGIVLHRLATGTDDTAPSAAPPPADLSAVHNFDEPVDQLDQLVFAAKRLADAMATSLHDRATMCTRFVVEAETEHAEVSQRIWYRAEGMNASAMVDRIRWQLDGWINGAEPPTAGVVLLRLTPTQVRHDVGVQEGFWGGRTRADENAARATTRVIGLLGPDSVMVASWRGGRDPQQAFDLVPAAEIGANGRRAIPRPTDSPDAHPWPGSVPIPAPALIHRTPEPVLVVDAHGETIAVNGRGLVSAEPAEMIQQGRSMRITGWAGPWPVEERWWEDRARRSARFQFVVEGPDGQRACLAEITTGSWWLTAEYV